MRKIAVLILITVIAATTFGEGSGNTEAVNGKETKMLGGRPLADDFMKVFESPNPENTYCYSPGIARCPSGRIIATLDLGGPGIQELPGPKGVRRSFRNTVQGKVFTSDDHGKTWIHRADFPFMHARPFMAGGVLYILGHCDDLMIVRSDDVGESWSPPITLTQGERWAQAPCNVQYANGCVYLVMEKRVYTDVKGWPVSVNAPVLMRGKIGDDLTKSESCRNSHRKRR